MRLYYSHSDASVYEMGHTVQKLFDQLYDMLSKLDLNSVYASRALTFMNQAVEHPMVLFMHPGNVYSDIVAIRDRRPNSERSCTLFNFFNDIEYNVTNPNNEMVVITAIRSEGSNFKVDYIHLDSGVITPILRKHFIDQVMETL